MACGSLLGCRLANVVRTALAVYATGLRDLAEQWPAIALGSTAKRRAGIVTNRIRSHFSAGVGVDDKTAIGVTGAGAAGQSREVELSLGMAGYRIADDGIVDGRKGCRESPEQTDALAIDLLETARIGPARVARPAQPRLLAASQPGNAGRIGIERILKHEPELRIEIPEDLDHANGAFSLIESRRVAP